MNTYHNHDRILEESRDDSPWAPGDSTTRRWKIKAIHYWIILLVALLVLLLRAKLTGEPSKPEDHPATLTTPPPISLSLLDDCHQTRVAHSLGPDEIPMGSHNRCEEKGEVSHVRGNF